MAFQPVHRVVTGHDANGKSIIVSDGDLPTVVELASIPGMVFHEIWETAGTPALVGNEPDPTLGILMHQAPERGTRIRFVDMPPDEQYMTAGDGQMKQLFDEVNDAKGLTVKADSPHPMMHRSEAVDYGIVFEGEMTLILDDSEVQLKPGSVVIQRGTNHAWANRSGKMCRMLFIQLDGEYDPVVGSALAAR
jgi:mannose-6-phosphate isomerase-like protein (cupin superfamily)